MPKSFQKRGIYIRVIILCLLSVITIRVEPYSPFWKNVGEDSSECIT